MPSFNTRKRRGRIFNKNKKKKSVRGNTRRSKSLEPSKKNSAEEIGSGGFGIVSRPAAKCDSFLNKNFNQNAWRAAYYNNPNYISKLTEYGSAKRELEVGLAIKDTIPFYEDYFCLVEFICNAPESKSINRNGDYYDTYAISPYCGIPLDDYLRNDINAPIHIFELCYLVPSLQHMVRGLQQIHLKHIYHKDIHNENFLYDSDSGLMRLIDFGLADDLRDIKNDNSPIIINQELHDLDMLVRNVIGPLINFLLDSRISTLNVRNKYPYVEDFYYELRQYYGRMYAIMNPKNGKSYKNMDNNEERLVRLLNVVHQFKELKSVNELAAQYNNVSPNNNNNK